MHPRQQVSGYFLRLFLTALLAVPLGFRSLSAQTPTPYPGDFQITTLTGLAQNSVHCVAQDDDGFIWFGTQTSLERFDGDPKHLAKWYVSRAGAAGYVKAIKTLPEGILVGTTDGKLLRLANRFSASLSPKLAILPISEDLGQILCVDSLNGHYLVVSKTGVYFLNSDGSVADKKEIGIEEMAECAIVSQNMVFVGAKDRLLQYKISNSEISFPEYKSNVEASSLLITGDTLWVGLKNGNLKALSASAFQFLNIEQKCSNKPITALLKTTFNEIWVGTDGDGIYFLKCNNLPDKKVIRREQGLSSNFIYHLFQSKDGVVFIGTSGGGLCRYYRNRVFRSIFQFDTVNNFIWSLHLHNDQYLLAGTRGAGIRLIDVYSGKDITPGYPSQYSKLSTLSIHCMEKVGDGYLLGTDSGLYQLNLKLPDIEYKVKYIPLGNDILFKHTINKILYIPDKDILVIGDRTQHRIVFVNRYLGGQSISEADVTGSYINAIIYNSDTQRLLIGTDKGINVFELDRGYPSNRSTILEEEPIMTSLEDSTEYYFATRTGRVFGVLKNNLAVHRTIIDNNKINNNDFPPPSALYSLLRDNKGFIWISSNVGLFRMDLKNRYLLDHFDDGNPIGQMEFNRGAFCSSVDGSKLYFGGPDGILEVNTKNIVYAGSFSPLIEFTYYVEGLNYTVIQNIAEEINLPNNFDYVDIRPLNLFYNENINHYLSIVINGDTVTPSGISPERLLSLSKRGLNFIGWPAWVKKRGITREGLSMPDTKAICFRFAGNKWYFFLSLWTIFSIVIIFYWFIKRTREKTSLIASTNKVSSIYGKENILKTAKEQLVTSFRFDYAIISLIDYKNKKLTSVESFAAEKVWYPFKRKKNPLLSIIDEWAKKSEYPLQDRDILCQVLNNSMQPVWFVGPLSDNKDLGYNNLNSEIYKKYGHWRFSRFFIPMVDRSNILGEPGEKDHVFPIGVIEIGSRRTLFRLAFDLVYFFIYCFANRLFHINLQPIKLDLQIFADNLSQTYLQSFVKEERIAIEDKIKSFNTEKIDDATYWANVLQQITEYTNSKYAEINVLTFNEQQIDLREAFITYPLEIKETIREKLDQVYKDQSNDEITGISKYVIRTQNVHIANDVNNDDYYIKVFPEIRSEMGIPIRYNGQIAAVLILSSEMPNAYSPVQVAIIDHFIHDVWAISLSKRRATALSNISSSNYNIASESTAKVYKPVVKALTEYFRSDFVAVWEKENLSEDWFVLLQDAMVSSVFCDMYESSQLTGKRITNILHKPEDSLVSVIKKEEPHGPAISDFLETHQFKQYIAIKVVVEGRYEAFINIFSLRDVQLSADEYLFLTQIANYLSASVIANKLFKTFRDLSKSFDQGQVMYQKLVDHAKDLSRADLVSFFPLVDGEYKFKEGIHSHLKEAMEFNDVEDRANLPRVILQLGHDLYISNEQEYIARLEEGLRRKLNSGDIERTFWRRFGNASVAAKLLTLDDKKLGIIFFNYKVAKDFTANSSTTEIIDIFSNFAKILILNSNFVEKIQEETARLERERILNEQRSRTYQQLILQNKETIEELVTITERYRNLVIYRSFYSMVDGLLHECKNYLFVLIDKLRKLEQESNTELIEQEVKKVRSYAQSISGILNIFNINTKDIESIDLVKVIRTILNFFKSFSDNNDIIFEIEDNQKIEITGNKTEIALVFHNLIDNAITAIDKMKLRKPLFQGRISVFFKDSPNYVDVEIRDNGVGIDAQYLPDKIFQRGFSTKTDGDNKVIGTGIGLSYVREILDESYKAEIRCQSSVGSGAGFLISFPKYKVK